MSASRQMKTIAVLLAGLVVVLLIGLLLVSGTRTEPGSPPPPAPAQVRRAPPVDGPPIGIVAPPAAEDPAHEHPATTLRGVAVLEDGSPFPGVVFLEMIPAEEEGAWEVDLEADPPVDHGGGKGDFLLRWKEARAEVVLLVMGRTAECVLAEGATIVGLEERGEVLRFAPGSKARLVFRPLPGRALTVNFSVDSPLGAVAVRDSGFRLLDGEGNALPRQGIGGPLFSWSEGNRTGFGIEVSFPVLTRSERAAGDRRVLEFTFPYFEALRLPVADLVDGMRVPLAALRPAVTGILTPPPSESAINGFSIAAPAGGGPRMDRVVEPGGAFRIYGVPAGDWVLRVMRKGPEGLRWGRREFRKEEGPVDLGIVEANGWAGLRFRLLDEEGRPVPQASLTVTRVGERDSSGPGVFIELERPGPRGGRILLRDDLLWIQRGAEPGDLEGWFEIPDLAPGTKYVVQDNGSPDLRAEVTTTQENGGWAEVELRRKAAR